MGDVVRRLVEGGLEELLVAGTARQPYVTHAAAPFGSFAGGGADTRLPAHLRHARPQWVTKRATFWLIFENRYWHGNDHAQTAGSLLLPGEADMVFGNGRIRMFRRRASQDDAWEGIVTGKKRSSPDGQNMIHDITVTLDDGSQKQVRVRGALWKQVNDGDRLVKQAGEKYPEKA
jgi:hypothetical protein